MMYDEIIPILLKFKTTIYYSLDTMRCDKCDVNKFLSMENKSLTQKFLNSIELNIRSDVYLIALFVSVKPDYLNDAELQNMSTDIYELFLRLTILEIDRLKAMLTSFNIKLSQWKTSKESPVTPSMVNKLTYVNLLKISLVMDEPISSVKNMFSISR
jgi:hypothetical protein